MSIFTIMLKYNVTKTASIVCSDIIYMINISNLGGGSNPIFAHGKMCVFPWGKKYMEREGNEYFSLSFHILFFPFFPMGKNGKTHIFP